MRLINLHSILFLFFLFQASWTIQAKCIYKDNIQAEELNIGNMISWTTISETNNEKFFVQKSEDGISFVTIGEVNGMGTIEEENNYRYLDISTGVSRSYYRLIQKDFSGEESTSPTIIVTRNTANQVVITSMSTTVTDRLFSVTLRSKVSEMMNFSMLDANGKSIKSGNVAIVNGVNVVSYDLEEFPKGWYTIHMDITEERETLLVQKVDSNEVPRLDFVVRE